MRRLGTFDLLYILKMKRKNDFAVNIIEINDKNATLQTCLKFYAAIKMYSHVYMYYFSVCFKIK